MISSLKKAYYRTYQKVFKVAMCLMDWSEPEVIEGSGAIKRLPKLVKSKNIKKVMVVTGKRHTKLHLLDSLYESLEAEGIEYVVFDNVQPNPTIPNIEDARKTYIDNKTSNLEQQVSVINQLLSTTKTSSVLLDNLQKDIEREVL